MSPASRHECIPCSQRRRKCRCAVDSSERTVKSRTLRRWCKLQGLVNDGRNAALHMAAGASGPKSGRRLFVITDNIEDVIDTAFVETIGDLVWADNSKNFFRAIAVNAKQDTNVESPHHSVRRNSQRHRVANQKCIDGPGFPSSRRTRVAESSNEPRRNVGHAGTICTAVVYTKPGDVWRHDYLSSSDEIGRAACRELLLRLCRVDSCESIKRAQP